MKKFLLALVITVVAILVIGSCQAANAVAKPGPVVMTPGPFVHPVVLQAGPCGKRCMPTPGAFVHPVVGGPYGGYFCGPNYVPCRSYKHVR